MKSMPGAAIRSRLGCRAADYGGPGLAARMHVAERECVVAVELSVPEAIGIIELGRLGITR
jgi:hypothetical protein